ncbi:hypothetical protein SKAU_G00055630 [Synaphobranchus kaupii]|uniref:Uncharacterized protein n=1 Tax=Synaphobranchus kaupii TaxID=118154 RepID=A0A9Q1G4R5_SYNKA|nr:hypothetical protein SKAU_G00055630 [Synaphobranchus kaupii]
MRLHVRESKRFVIGLSHIFKAGLIALVSWAFRGLSINTSSKDTARCLWVIGPIAPHPDTPRAAALRAGRFSYQRAPVWSRPGGATSPQLRLAHSLAARTWVPPAVM